MPLNKNVAPFAVIRKHDYKTNKMKDRFENVTRDNILSFLKEIKIIAKLNLNITLKTSSKANPNSLNKKQLDKNQNQERSLEKHKNKSDHPEQFITWHKITPNEFTCR